MYNIINKDVIINFAKIFLIGFLVVVCTFPTNEWTYSVGIDPPLFWVYNHLFETDLTAGKHIIFPHGPLAFFMYPMPENILLATLVESILKILLVFNLVFLLSKQAAQTKWLLAFVAAYFISIVSGFNHIVLANVILLYCNIYSNGQRTFRYLVYFLTAFAFYVKAYVAIISGVIFVSYISHNLYFDRRIKTFVLDCLSLLGFILFFWFVMYGTLSGFIGYLWGMFHLAQDNSSAVAYYPYNNWVVLSLFLLSFPLLIVLNKTKGFYFYAILIALSLFAAWKHGMARQDVYHVNGFYIYFIICAIILLVYYAKNTLVNLSVIVFAFIMFSINLTNSLLYQSPRYEFFRVNNFIQFITEYDALISRSERISLEAISINKLPKSILDSIGNSTVDVYPWDYSVISVNNLNWKPRAVINSYASYTTWLDEQNAHHFNSDEAPNYLIWELNKISTDLNGSDFNSIDNRYLLNDEPQTMVELLKKYERWFSNEKFIILKKRKESLTVAISNTPEIKLSWGVWQDAPPMNDGQLLRAKMHFNNSLVQRLKSFAYKDEQFWIYLKLHDNSIHKYRMVPKNAADGLWINPYVYNTDKMLSVKAIMFKASNEAILNENVFITWETFDFKTSNIITDFFAVKKKEMDSTAFQFVNNFEKNTERYWTEIGADLVSTDAYEGKKSFVLKPGMFSCTFSYPLDSISIDNMRIEADCWIKGSEYKYSNEIQMVISVDGDEGNIIWKGISVAEQFIDNSNWNHIYNYVNHTKLKSNCELKGYLWNNSTKEILVDDFRIRVTSNQSR